jgi:preprotein translocase subunit YajC
MTAAAFVRGTVLTGQPIIVNLLLIYIVVIGGVFIYMTSRGNKKRQSQASQLQQALVVGAEVRTVGGLVGEVVEVTDEHVIIETTPGVRLRFVKSSVAGVVPPSEPEEAVDGGEEPAADGREDGAAGPSDRVPTTQAEADEESRAGSEAVKR